MKRKRLSEGDVLRVLIEQGALIPCYRCRVAFICGDRIEREHLIELALGGEDTLENMVYSHKSCHHEITNGTKATTAGSSKQRIAKVRRLRGENKPKMKRKWPAGRKRQGRPFQKRKPA